MPFLKDLIKSIRNLAIRNKDFINVAKALEQLAGVAGLIAQDVTYDELVILQANSDLVPGSTYRITDHRISYKQPFTDPDRSKWWDAVNNNVIKTGALEPLILTATSDNTFHPIVRSELYPLDTIKYTLDNSAEPGADRGVIFYREDMRGNCTPYDFRNVKFVRYNFDRTGLPKVYSTTGAERLINKGEWFEYVGVGFTRLYFAVAPIGLNGGPGDAISLQDENYSIWPYDPEYTLFSLPVDLSTKKEYWTFTNDDGYTPNNEDSARYTNVKVFSDANDGGYDLSNNIFLIPSADTTLSGCSDNMFGQLLSCKLLNVQACTIGGKSSKYSEMYAVQTGFNQMNTVEFSNVNDVLGYAWNIVQSTINNVETCAFSQNWRNVQCMAIRNGEYWAGMAGPDGWPEIFNAAATKFLERDRVNNYHYWLINGGVLENYPY